MLDTVANTFRVPDLRRRVIITILLLCACRIGVFIPLPGVDTGALRDLVHQFDSSGEGSSDQMMNFINIFTGGALQQMALFGLGVMPYISASIIFQLLVQVIPSLKKIAEEGEVGRRKINQYTRYATVALCLFQGPFIIRSLNAMGAGQNIFPDFGIGMYTMAALLLTGGTMLLMWLGEQIDEYGIGNGISLIIMTNIVARLPVAIRMLARQFEFSLTPGANRIGVGKVLFLVALFIGVVFAIIYITQGQRRIPFQQAKQMRGRRVYGGMKHYLPIQVNAANVIPIIFAQSLLMFPYTGARALERSSETGFFHALGRMLTTALDPASFTYTLLYVALIFFFCYFWTAITFNPTDMAKNLQEHGSFIPGIRPGRRTAEYLERVMVRITLPGAASLALIAIVPRLMGRALNLPWLITEFFGGTTILIAVGVALDLVKKIEAQLLVRHYEGFTRGGRRRF